MTPLDVVRHLRAKRPWTDIDMDALGAAIVSSCARHRRPRPRFRGRPSSGDARQCLVVPPPFAQSSHVLG